MSNKIVEDENLKRGVSRTCFQVSKSGKTVFILFVENELLMISRYE